MRIKLTLWTGTILKISETIYSDPSQEKINQCAKEILQALEKLK